MSALRDGWPPANGSGPPASDQAARVEALTVAELVAQPGLGLELLAGAAGAEREVRWIATSEHADPSPWLAGGEVVLTTGMTLEDDDSWDAFARAVASVGGAAVGFSPGFGVHDTVPPSLLAAGEELGLPVFRVPYELPFVAVTEAAMTRIVDAGAERLRGALDLHERLTALVLEERGLTALLSEAARLTGFGLALVDGSAQELARAGAVGGRPAERLAIRSPDGVEAVLCAFAAHAPDERDRVMLAHVRTVLALELLKRRAVRETERRLAGDLIAELLDGALPARELARHLRAFGFADEAPLAFVLVRGGAATPEAACRRIAPVLARAAAASVVVPSDGLACALLTAADAEAAEAAGAAVAEALPGAAVGVGSPRTDPRELSRSHDEAYYALEARAAHGARTGLATPRDLGSLQLVLSLQDARGLELFCDAVIGRLEAHDRAAGAQLCASLEAFIEANGRWAEAAERLFVHRHTLRYRMRRVEELTGRDMDSARDRLECWLALKAREVQRRRAGQA